MIATEKNNITCQWCGKKEHYDNYIEKCKTITEKEKTSGIKANTIYEEEEYKEYEDKDCHLESINFKICEKS